MQRWQADDDDDRPRVRRRFRDDDPTPSDDDELVIDLTDEAMAAHEVDGRDFTFLSRFRSRR